jgi:amino acid transporter
MSFLNYVDALIDRVRSRERSDGKVGAFFGVLLPGILSVFGVITFLRLPQILGQSGSYYFSIILLIGILINLLTAFSISSTVTNFTLRSGGVYTLLSRCFGAELGIAVTLPLYLSQAINIAFCLMGLLEIVEGALFVQYKVPIGLSILAVLLLLSWLNDRGIRFLQLLVFLALITAFSFVAYTLEEPQELIQQYSLKKPFWQIFAAFFPAITGFESGLFTIDQLRSPKKAFPIGTILTVMLSFVLYLFFGFLLTSRLDPVNLLLQDKILMQLVKPSWILYQALIGSTLLYALGCLLNAPKLLQAMVHDAFSSSKFFTKIHGAKEVPLATLITLTIAGLFFVLFDLDLLSPLLTHFFLLSYAMVNLACFIESFMQNPSWRPSFFIPYVYPLAGFFLTFFCMLMIDPGLTLLSWTFVVLIYFGMRVKNFTQNFDDIRQGMLLYLTRFATYRLVNFHQVSFRSWRPQVICFSQNLTHMTPTIKIAKSLTQDKGFLIVASALRKDLEEEKIPHFKRMVRDFFAKHEIDAIIELITGKTIDHVVHQMIQAYGLGPIKPNTILFSYDLERGSVHKFEEWMKEVEIGHKNGLILCYKEGIFKEEFTQFWLIKQPKKKKIQIFLENETKLEQYFLLVLASLLQKSDQFFQADVEVAVVAKDPDAKEALKEYYEEFFIQNRFDFDLKVDLKEQQVFSSADLVMLTYTNFSQQIDQAKEIANRGGLTLLVHQREKLAFEKILD